MNKQHSQIVNRKISVIKISQSDDGSQASRAENAQSFQKFLQGEFSGENQQGYEDEGFVQQLIQQAHEARMAKLQDKILESIMIEKEQRIITSGSNLKVFYDQPLEEISPHENAYYQKLSEEFYGKRCDQNNLDSLVKNFISTLKQLQNLWDDIVIIIEADQIPIKKVKANFPLRKGNKTQSPTSGSCMIKRESRKIQTRDFKNIDPKLELLKMIQKENCSFEIDNARLDSLKCKAPQQGGSNRVSPQPYERNFAVKYLKPILSPQKKKNKNWEVENTIPMNYILDGKMRNKLRVYWQQNQNSRSEIAETIETTQQRKAKALIKVQNALSLIKNLIQQFFEEE